MNYTPNPGSESAVAQGCKCPVLDNARGKGAFGGARDGRGELLFWKNDNCPLHGQAARLHPPVTSSQPEQHDDSGTGHASEA